MQGRVIEFHEGWRTIQAGIDKVVSLVDAGGQNHGEIRNEITPDDYMSVYTAVYQLCTQLRSYDRELYSCYQAFFINYVQSQILPALREKSGELLLREVVKKWQNYKIITLWMSRFFRHLSRLHYRHNFTTLHNAALLILQNLAYGEMKGKIIGAVLSLIKDDREGKSVDRALIKDVLEIVYDPQSETLNAPYEIDFEPAFLDSSCSYYLIKNYNWSYYFPSLTYMSQAVVEWMNAEKFRAAQYLYPSTVTKLLELLNHKLGIRDLSDVKCLSGKVQQLKLG